MARNQNSTIDHDIDLSALEPDFQRAKVWDDTPGSRQVEIPDGYYDVRIDDVRLGRAVNSQNPVVTWRLRVLGPNHAGAVLYKRRALTSKTMQYFKEDLERCAMKLDRISEFQDRMHEMTGRQVGLFKKTRNDDVNLWFTRPEHVNFGERMPAHDEPKLTDDELPF